MGSELNIYANNPATVDDSNVFHELSMNYPINVGSIQPLVTIDRHVFPSKASISMPILGPPLTVANTWAIYGKTS